jgi:hypothetical protein
VQGYALEGVLLALEEILTLGEPLALGDPHSRVGEPWPSGVAELASLTFRGLCRLTSRLGRLPGCERRRAMVALSVEADGCTGLASELAVVLLVRGVIDGEDAPRAASSFVACGSSQAACAASRTSASRAALLVLRKAAKGRQRGLVFTASRLLARVDCLVVPSPALVLSVRMLASSGASFTAFAASRATGSTAQATNSSPLTC